MMLSPDKDAHAMDAGNIHGRTVQSGLTRRSFAPNTAIPPPCQPPLCF